MYFKNFRIGLLFKRGFWFMILCFIHVKVSGKEKIFDKYHTCYRFSNEYNIKDNERLVAKLFNINCFGYIHKRRK